jgi:hypothetical protein
MRRILLPLAAVAAALALAGCGSGESSSAGGFEGQEKEVAQVVEDLQRAAQSRDGGKVCSELLARELVDELSSGDQDCIDEVEKAIGDADDYELRVTDVSVEGESATATVEDGDRRAKFALVRQDGRWRIAEMDAA